VKKTGSALSFLPPAGITLESAKPKSGPARNALILHILPGGPGLGFDVPITAGNQALLKEDRDVTGIDASAQENYPIRRGTLYALRC
jgi:hypothetical protein